MTDKAVEDAAQRIVEAIDHLVIAAQDVAAAIREAAEKEIEVPKFMRAPKAFEPEPVLEAEDGE